MTAENVLRPVADIRERGKHSRGPGVRRHMKSGRADGGEVKLARVAEAVSCTAS